MENIILITGVAGFIASKTAELLLNNGETVIGVDNMNDYYDVNLKKHRLEQLRKYENFRFYLADIEDYSDLDVLFKKYNFQAVLNLAARAGVRYSLENPYIYLSTNSLGTLNLLDLMRVYNVRKMVVASTSSLYAGQSMPFMESLPVNSPISPYAASKKAAEVLAYTYHFQFGLDISVVRYFTVYGPASRPDMAIFRFVKWIAEGKVIELNGNGSQSRDFTYIDDISTGTIAAMRSVGYEIINLGGGRNPVSIIEIIEKLESLIGKKANIVYKPFHKADMEKTWANIEKANKLLNWQPKIGIDEGLKRTVEWYFQNQQLCSAIHI
ncbi:MAG: GDP-mannose 4,6-dehydratase [Cytophagaceae bacterium]